MILANPNERQRADGSFGHLKAFDKKDGVVSSGVSSCTGGERKGTSVISGDP